MDFQCEGMLLQGLAAIAGFLAREGNLDLERYTIHLEPLKGSQDMALRPRSVR